jgi:3-oxosteroid 1-dehydrogenase
VSTSQQWDETFDLVVVGSGAGGMTAALVAAANKAKVVIIEKSELFGGTSATSGGTIWVPATHLAEAAGQQDTVEEGFQYIRALSAPNVTDERIRAFTRTGREMVRWLEDNSEVRFRAVPYTDYHAEVQGGKMGFRTHDPVPLDGRRLGDDLARMRAPSPATIFLNRISWVVEETHPLLFRPKGWWKTLLRVLWRYYGDVGQRLRSSRDRFLTLGNALVGRFKLSLDARGVPLWMKTTLVDLVAENGKVTGVIVERDGRTLRLQARQGVVLAAGGFERNAEMRTAYLKGSDNPGWSGSQVNNTGDGIRLGQKLGAKLINMHSAWWAPSIKIPGEDRARMVTFERALPGSIVVNQAGRRYQNEAASYHICGQGMIDANTPDAGTIPSWMIFDSKYRHKFPVGPILPMVPDFLLPSNVRSILYKANTWAELAAKIGVPASALTETVEKFNAGAHRGKDPEFGRGDAAYDRYYGDHAQQPNPNLRALTEGPFYAVPLWPGDIGTNGGVDTNEFAQVLNTDDRPIPGLYAVGNMAATVMGYCYPGAGGTLGPAMTFGYIAARHATHGRNEPEIQQAAQ